MSDIDPTGLKENSLTVRQDLEEKNPCFWISNHSIPE